MVNCNLLYQFLGKMKTEMKRQVWFWFVIITILSPWLWLVIKGPRMLLLDPASLYKISLPARISEINTLRGEASSAGVGLLGRLVVNKATWAARDAFSRILSTFDPHYLLLEGDVDITRSTGKTGPVFLTLAPLAIWSFWHRGRRQQTMLVALILAAVAGAAMFEPYYFLPARLGFFVIYNWLAAEGVVLLYKTRGAKWLIVYLAVIGFEIARFAHDFQLHYPYRTSL